MKKPQADRLRQILADQIVEAMIPYISGWVKTLGLAGAPGNRGVSASARVSAAKTGIELVTKFMSSGTSVSGENLLRMLEDLNKAPGENNDDDDPDDTPDPDGAEGESRP